ncbi:cytochrome P450 [Wolfiporia cocos MD-104 SS10]|uniref:Cytochrome P450 n=1 Tax=Wolfiporia cocos (strain MD-104) TaxID=742152 RepID=A0A2H3JR16_WOLCO|nr:cytochrome P450 [Wolfiporia cocos MD-104 SS10]
MQQSDATEEPFDERDIMGAAATVHGAATEMTTATIISFIVAMLLFPDVMEKAQAEVDRVVGFSRFPTSEDRESLPHLEATLKEVYRWSPVVALGT